MFKIKLADTVIAIKCFSTYIKKMCKDYVTEEDPDFAIEITSEDVEKEQEYLAVYRKICEKLVDYDTLLIHGSCVVVENKAYLFIGRSGIGKSTHSKLWRKYLGGKVTMLNDDKPLVKITKKGPIIYGTPWDGKHHLSTNASCPLKAIVHIKQAVNNELISSDNYIDVIKQIFKPKKISRINHSLELANEMLKNVDLYTMQCNIEDEAAKICFEGINS